MRKQKITTMPKWQCRDFLPYQVTNLAIQSSTLVPRSHTRAVTSPRWAVHTVMPCGSLVMGALEKAQSEKYPAKFGFAFAMEVIMLRLVVMSAHFVIAMMLSPFFSPCTLRSIRRRYSHQNIVCELYKKSYIYVNIF